MFAQTPSTPERFVTPVRTDLPGRTVWAFATTGTGTNITTFAATDKGLFRSTGTNWTEVTALKNQEVYAVKSRRVGNTSTLLVGTKKGVLRSVDGGTTWSSPEVTTGTVISTSNILELKKVFDIEIVNTTWFAATDKGVFRSSNDGRTWTLLNIDRSVDNNEVRGITAEGSTIIVNLWREGLWRSTNNGGSWSKLTIAGETALIRAVHAQQGTSATIWLAGSVAGNLWRSVNSGSSWTRVYQTASTARNTAISSLAQAGIDALTGWERSNSRGGERYIYLFASTPTGIAYSINQGETWQLTRTSATKAIALTAWDNTLYVGVEAETGSTTQEYVILNDGKGGSTVSAEAPITSAKNQGTSLNNGPITIIPAPAITRYGQSKFTNYCNSFNQYLVPQFTKFI